MKTSVEDLRIKIIQVAIRSNLSEQPFIVRDIDRNERRPAMWTDRYLVGYFVDDCIKMVEYLITNHILIKTAPGFYKPTASIDNLLILLKVHPALTKSKIRGMLAGSDPKIDNILSLLAQRGEIIEEPQNTYSVPEYGKIREPNR